MKHKIILLAIIITLFLWAGRSITPGQAAQASPEIIDDGHYLSGNGSDITYSTNGAEGILCGNIKGEVYGRVPYGGDKSDRLQLLTGCDASPFPDRAMVTTGKETYIISELNLTSTHALFVRPADGSGPAMQLTSNQNVAPGALASDGDFVYYVVLSGTSSQIVRRNVDSGAVDVVSPVGDMVDMINGLALDDTHVYWTEGFPGSNGRIRRVLKSGGVPEGVVDGLEFPVNIVTFQSLVYWAEEGGNRLARRLKSGAGITHTVYATDRPVTALHIHDDIVYFGTGTTGTSNGSLWRVDLDGQNPTLMAYDFSPPRGILWAGGWIYWVDSKLRRLSPTAVSDPVDYVVEHIEVTQGVQDGDHTMPLVTGKPTMVRVYAREVKNSADALVTATLHGYRSGISMPGSPLKPVLNGNIDLTGDLPGRGDVDQTYVFQLPESWLMDETIQLQAEINPDQQVFETDFGNNDYPQAPQTFDSIFRMVCLITYPVAAVSDEGDQTIFSNDPEVFDPRMARAKVLLPTLVYIEKSDTILYDSDDDGNQIPHNLVEAGGETRLFDTIAATADLSDPTPGCDPAFTRYAGLVDVDAANPSGLGGRANGENFWARWWDSESGLPYVQPAGGFLWAHELAHTLDRPHVDCGGANGPGFYPYADPCTNGDSNDFDAAWGFDPITGAAPDPTDHRDLMAYGSQRWVSDFTWRCLSDFIGTQWSLPGMNTADCDAPLSGDEPDENPSSDVFQNAAVQTTKEDILYIHGSSAPPTTYITTTNDIVSISYPDNTLLTESQKRQLATAPNGGPWQITIFDSGGQLLSSKFIEPAEASHDSEDLEGSFFSVALAVPQGAARIEIRDTTTGSLLFEKNRGPNRPTIANPSIAVKQNGDLVATFSARDTDGDRISVIAQFIDSDGRKTLLSYTGRGSGSTYRCNPCSWPGRSLPGGQGHVRLLVSDGFYTATVDMAVNMPKKAPEVSLFASQFGPIDDDGFATFRLEASVWDSEDLSVMAPSPDQHASLRPSSIQVEWFINEEQKDISISEEPIIFLSKDIFGLSEGDSPNIHVTVRATDSDGQVSESTIEVNLKPTAGGGSHKVFLPFVQAGD